MQGDLIVVIGSVLQVALVMDVVVDSVQAFESAKVVLGHLVVVVGSALQAALGTEWGVVNSA